MSDSLSTKQISHLRSLAQRLDAHIHIGKNGLTEAFLGVVREALTRQELIKVKFSDLKDQKKTIAPELAQKTESTLVTLIGNVAVLYRQQPDPSKRKISLP